MFMKSVKVRDLVTTMGDVHHIFPKKYLQNSGINDKAKYNQIANFTYFDTQNNISVGEKAPNEYFGVVFGQCDTKNCAFGDIDNKEALEKNLKMNCIPLDIVSMDYTRYDDFLLERRKLMAAKIKDYYYSL